MSNAAPLSKPFWVKCGSCSHVWTAVHYPMELRAFADAARAAVCPSCGEDTKIFPAKQTDGVLEEKAP